MTKFLVGSFTWLAFCLAIAVMIFPVLGYATTVAVCLFLVIAGDVLLALMVLTSEGG